MALWLKLTGQVEAVVELPDGREVVLRLDRPCRHDNHLRLGITAPPDVKINRRRRDAGQPQPAGPHPAPAEVPS
jgi:hypothetical protein